MLWKYLDFILRNSEQVEQSEEILKKFNQALQVISVHNMIKILVTILKIFLSIIIIKSNHLKIY
jgi:hypothetical protein